MTGCYGSTENDGNYGSDEACFGETLRFMEIGAISVLRAIGLIRCCLRLMKKIGDISVIRMTGAIRECLRLVKKIGVISVIRMIGVIDTISACLPLCKQRKFDKMRRRWCNMTVHS